MRLGGDHIGDVNKMVNKQTEQMMEPERLEYFLDGMAISLQRIASSLEQIAEAVRPQIGYYPQSMPQAPEDAGDSTEGRGDDWMQIAS